MRIIFDILCGLDVVCSIAYIYLKHRGNSDYLTCYKQNESINYHHRNVETKYKVPSFIEWPIYKLNHMVDLITNVPELVVSIQHA